MSSETSSGGGGSCGCCGCFMGIVLFVVIVSLLMGEFAVNGTKWNLDLFPPGLNSVEEVQDGNNQDEEKRWAEKSE